MSAARVVTELSEDQLSSCLAIASGAAQTAPSGCVVVDTQRHKALSRNSKGYVQIKVYGAAANKKVQLHQLVVWCHPDLGQRTTFRSAIRDGTLEISHLCKKKDCMNPQHFVAESCAANKLRNGCSVVVCFNGQFYSCCRHAPPACVATDVDFAEAKSYLV